MYASISHHPDHNRTTRPPLTDLCADLTRLGLVGLELLPDDGEVWLVRRQAQHDEIGVGAAQTVVRVRVVVGLRALTPDVVHDLVLACMRTHSVTSRGVMTSWWLVNCDSTSTCNRSHATILHVHVPACPNEI